MREKKVNKNCSPKLKVLCETALAVYNDQSVKSIYYINIGGGRKVLTDGTTRGISYGRRRTESAAEAAECRPQRRSESDQQAVRTVPSACLQRRDVRAFRPALGFGLPSPAAPRGAETDGPPIRASDRQNDPARGRKKNDSPRGATSPVRSSRRTPLSFSLSKHSQNRLGMRVAY